MAEYIAAQEKRAKSYVPDDGLDDDEEDLRLYGNTGLPKMR